MSREFDLGAGGNMTKESYWEAEVRQLRAMTRRRLECQEIADLLDKLLQYGCWDDNVPMCEQRKPCESRCE